MAEQITKDLGGITAYAAAVAAGYTGTKAQFETLMASYATVAQNAAASATAANGSAEDAEAYAVGTRDGSDVGSTDPAYHNNAKYYAELAEDYADSIDPDTLAKIDGYYQEMTVGDAEQIVSSILVEDKAPYQFRTAGGSVDIGKRAYFDAIVGGTVAWNQLASALDATHWSNSASGTTNMQFSDGVASFLGTVQYAGLSLDSNYRPPSLKDHKYFFSVTAKAESSAELQARSFGGYGDINFTASTSWTTASRVFNLPEGDLSSGNRAILLRDKRASGWDTVSFKNVMLIDITLLLGSTIADHIYSLEQATAGAGVAFFRKYFPNSYYPYNAESLESVEVSAHKTNGFNQFDKDAVKTSEGAYILNDNGVKVSDGSSSYFSEATKVLPNTAYYVLANGDNVDGLQKLYYFDADDNFISRTGYISSGVYTTPSNCHYIRYQYKVATVDTSKWCINLSWDGSRDGEYEEYKEHSYPLDDSLTLRGIPKLVDGKLQFDGDEYLPDGTVTRRYGVVDLGSLDWAYSSGYFSTSSIRYIAKGNTNYNQPTDNMVCTKYTIVAWTESSEDKAISMYTDGRIAVFDSSYTDATSFKNSLSGVYLVYELATPTTEEADAYNGIQIVDDFGTEEFITDTVVPVGHVTHYPVNLVAKLEMQPNSPDGNGDYIVQQASGINTYIPLASTDTITGIIARLEALEQAAGIGGE